MDKEIGGSMRVFINWGNHCAHFRCVAFEEYQYTVMVSFITNMLFPSLSIYVFINLLMYIHKHISYFDLIHVCNNYHSVLQSFTHG